MSDQQLLPKHADRIEERISELGLDDFRSPILKGAYSAYDLIGVKQGDSRKKGTTRFGGHPDLPDSFNAEELNEFEFVYQVNCADLPDGELLGLPSEGLLSVFSNSEPYYGGKTLYFKTPDLIRHRMPDPVPDYIFSDVKPWKLKIATSVGFAQYGDDLFDEIEDAGLSDEYEQLCDTEFNNVSGPCFGEILGRYSDLNGDMREEAANNCGGKPTDWRSLWKVFSSWESGLVISDFHLLHGMIRKRHLKALDLSKMFSTQSNG
jgi:hypothetical protein